MRTLLVLALLLAGSGVVYADGVPGVNNATSTGHWTRTVFNDSGSSMVSGEIAVWDNDDTEFDRSGYPYVTTTTATDSPWVAGVVDDGLTCPNQTLCEIVVRGMAIVKIADATDAVAEDTLISTSSVDGQAGDWGNGDDTCFLGMITEAYDVDNALDTNRDGSRMWVDVNPGCN